MKPPAVFLAVIFAFASCISPDADVDTFYREHHADTTLIRQLDGVAFSTRDSCTIVELANYDHLSFRVNRNDGRILNSDSSADILNAKYGIDPVHLIDSLHGAFKTLNVIGMFGYSHLWYSFDFPSGRKMVYVPDVDRLLPSTKEYLQSLRAQAVATYDEKWFAYIDRKSQ
jgi:hypothetical protein